MSLNYNLLAFGGFLSTTTIVSYVNQIYLFIGTSISLLSSKPVNCIQRFLHSYKLAGKAINMRQHFRERGEGEGPHRTLHNSTSVGGWGVQSDRSSASRELGEVTQIKTNC